MSTLLKTEIGDVVSEMEQQPDNNIMDWDEMLLLLE